MKVLCVLCVLGGFVFPARALEREAFTFTRYDLNVSIEPEQQRLGVRGKVTLRNDSDSPQRNVILQVSSTLHWVSIRVGGKPIQFLTQTYNSDIDHTGALGEAIVSLPNAIAPKQQVELEIGYEGTIPQDATRLTKIGVLAETAKHSDWDQIGPTFTAVRGIGYVAWYPMATEAASLADGSSVAEAVGRWKRREAQSGMRIRFSQSNSSGISDSLYCSGISGPTWVEGEGKFSNPRSECEFRSLGLTVPLFAIASFQVLDRPFVNISYLRDHKSGAEDYALAVEQVLPFVTKWFGDRRERPELKAEVVELPDPKDSAFQSGNMLLTPLSENQTGMLLSAIQQMTRLLFPSPRTWISDGLAGYAAARYIEQERGRDAALTYLQGHRAPLVEAEASRVVGNNRAAEVALISSVDDFYVATKAANVWWMLRELVGDEALNAALHNYKATEDNDANYMQKLIEAQARRDLSWFFEDWVYHDRGLPDFRLASVYTHAVESGGKMVTVTVENLGEAAAEVPVTIRMATGEATQKLLVPAKSKATVRILAASTPLEAVVNDGSVPESDMNNNVYKIEPDELNH